jgi:hypothetical protein
MWILVIKHVSPLVWPSGEKIIHPFFYGGCQVVAPTSSSWLFKDNGGERQKNLPVFVTEGFCQDSVYDHSKQPTHAWPSRFRNVL